MTLSTYPISTGLPAFNLGPSFLEYAIQREMKMASIKENLIAAKALIADPMNWGQGPDRDCFCILDAADDVSGKYGDLFAADLLGEFLPPGYEPDPSNWNHPVAQFNDDPATTHADIMAVYDRAIAAQDEVA